MRKLVVLVFVAMVMMINAAYATTRVDSYRCYCNECEEALEHVEHDSILYRSLTNWEETMDVKVTVVCANCAASELESCGVSDYEGYCEYGINYIENYLSEHNHTDAEYVVEYWGVIRGYDVVYARATYLGETQRNLWVAEH